MTGRIRQRTEFDGPTLAQWKRANAFKKGYLSYLYGKVRGSEIPDACPYKDGSAAHRRWVSGATCAAIAAQEGDD